MENNTTGMIGRYSYHGARIEGTEMLMTVGAMVQIGKDLFYVPKIMVEAPGQIPQQRMINELNGAQAKGLAPDDIFDYYIDRSNGVTDSFSQPIRVQGKTQEDILAKVRAKVLAGKEAT